MNKKAIISDKAPAAVGPYVHGVQVGNLFFISGQLGLDPVTGVMVEGVEAQAHVALKNLGAILEEVGSSYNDVVKTTIFLKDMGDFALVNSIYSEYFNDEKPARSCIEVARLPKDGLVEIEAVAIVK